MSFGYSKTLRFAFLSSCGLTSLLVSLLWASSSSSAASKVSVVLDSSSSATWVEGRPRHLRPSSIVADRDGYWLIVEQKTNRVLRLSPDGRRVERLLGRVDRIAGAVIVTDDPKATKLESPKEVVVERDGGRLILDSGNHRVLRLSADGTKVELLVGRADGFAGTAIVADDPRKTELGRPSSIVIESDGSRLITDKHNHRILRLSPDGRHIELLAGSADGHRGRELVGDNPHQAALRYPTAVVLDRDGARLIIDQHNHRILRLSPDGSKLDLLIGSVHGRPGARLVADNPHRTRLRSPRSITVDRDGSLLVADQGNHRVLRLSPDRRTVECLVGCSAPIQSGEQIIEKSPQQTKLDCPSAVVIGRDGSRLIIDSGNYRILRLSADGRKMKLALGSREGIYGSNIVAYDPSLTRLADPTMLTVTPDGALLIVDRGNRRVLLVAPDDDLQLQINWLVEDTSRWRPENKQRNRIKLESLANSNRQTVESLREDPMSLTRQLPRELRLELGNFNDYNEATRTLRVGLALAEIDALHAG